MSELFDSSDNSDGNCCKISGLGETCFDHDLVAAQLELDVLNAR
jgi:hypothetical protein